MERERRYVNRDEDENERLGERGVRSRDEERGLYGRDRDDWRSMRGDRDRDLGGSMGRERHGWRGSMGRDRDEWSTRDWRETEPYVEREGSRRGLGRDRDERMYGRGAGGFGGGGLGYGGYRGYGASYGGEYDRDRAQRGYDEGDERLYRGSMSERLEGRPRDDRFEDEDRGLMERIGEGVRRFFGGEREDERGPHAGKGPKGYRRSDERIREDVCDRIAEYDYLDASEVEVRVNEGVVTLSGTVEHRRDKRVLEDLIENVSGVKDVHNTVRVQPREIAQRGALRPGETRAS